MPIKPGMLMRLRLNRGLERTQIPVELISYNPLSLFCFQMYNNISIKIFSYSIKTKQKNPQTCLTGGCGYRRCGLGLSWASLVLLCMLMLGGRRTLWGLTSSALNSLARSCRASVVSPTIRSQRLLSALWDEVVEFVMRMRA